MNVKFNFNGRCGQWFIHGNGCGSLQLQTFVSKVNLKFVIRILSLKDFTYDCGLIINMFDDGTILDRTLIYDSSWWNLKWKIYERERYMIFAI
jgi:hypothetical protein